MTTQRRTTRTKADLEQMLTDAICQAAERDAELAHAERRIGGLMHDLDQARRDIAHLSAMIDVALEEQDFLRDQLIAARASLPNRGSR